MAIYGDLEDHTLSDLAAVLRRRSGVLYVHKAYRGRTVEVVLKEGEVRGLYLDGFPTRDAAGLQDVLGHLAREQQGAFEFEDNPNPAGDFVFKVGFEELVREATLAAPVLDGHLAGSTTRFVMVPGRAVPAPLREVWEQLLPHLWSGTSAQELAAATGQPEEALRRRLAQFRTAGLLVPRRAAEVQGTPGTALGAAAPSPFDIPAVAASAVPGMAPTGAETLAPLLGRMIGVLRRLTGAGRA